MGLDCTAYQKVELVEAISLAKLKSCDWDHPLYNEDGIEFLYNPDFPERGDGLVEGLYRTTGKELHIHAGPYSSYFRYRQWLASLSGRKAETFWEARGTNAELAALPFFEQIDFSDCEGFLGPKTCSALLEDYKAYQSKCNNADFAEWLAALEVAAGDGVIRFH